jgi:hypothetical protein
VSVDTPVDRLLRPVTAVDARGDRRDEVATQATPVWKPAAPSGLRAAAASRQVTLTWNAPASNGKPITDYVIQRSAGSNP